MSHVWVARSAIGRFLLVASVTMLLLSISQTPVYASQVSASATITVVAVVAPSRTVVVDTSGTIEKIVSNSPEYAEPQARLGSLDGREVPYSQAMRNQYALIMHAYTPLHSSGVIYDAAVSQLVTKPRVAQSCHGQCLPGLLRLPRLSRLSTHSVLAVDVGRVSVL